MPADATAAADTAVVLRASAKINLSLRILGIRKNGFHEIQSLFAPISLYDDIVVAPGEKTQSQVQYVTTNNAPLDYPNDTVTRALQVLKGAKVFFPPLDIKIKKRIPSGGGLGGGSSDAAIVMKFLFERFAVAAAEGQTFGEPPSEQLSHLALQVGSDVPFFLGKGATLVSGIGEKLNPIGIESFAVLVSVPPFEVLTKDAYSWFDKECELTHRGTDVTTSMIDGAITSSGIFGKYPRVLSLREIVEIMKNDLEKPVETRHPEIGILKKALRNWGALGSLMSGSGSSVYGVFRSLNEAIAARENLQQNFPSTYAFFACETLV